MPTRFRLLGQDLIGGGADETRCRPVQFHGRGQAVVIALRQKSAVAATGTPAHRAQT